MPERESNSARRVSVGVVDDHQVLTEALAVVIQHEPGMDFVGSASSCDEARDLVTRRAPNVLLLDVNLPDGDGLELVPFLKQISSDTQILVLTSYSDEETLVRAVGAGVSGFVGKTRPMVEVLAAIRQAAEGEIVMPVSLLVGVLARKSQRADSNQGVGKVLTTREKEILEQMARGKSSQAIAETFNISYQTVRTHIRNIMGKLKTHSQLAAVAYALRQGLIDPPSQ